MNEEPNFTNKNKKSINLISSRWFGLGLERPGVITPPNKGYCWVLFYGECYMICNTSLLGLLWELVRQYKNDSQIVG